MFTMRSGDAELNSGILTICKLLVQYISKMNTFEIKPIELSKSAKEKTCTGKTTNDLDNNTILKGNDGEKLWQLNGKLSKDFHCDRHSNCFVMISAPKCIRPKLRKDLKKLNPSHFESL